MSNEQDRGREQREQIVVRSPEEIQRRMEQIQSWLDLHRHAPTVTMMFDGVNTVNRPNYPGEYRVWEQYVAKLNELRWLLGENLRTTDGVE